MKLFDRDYFEKLAIDYRLSNISIDRQGHAMAAYDKLYAYVAEHAPTCENGAFGNIAGSYANLCHGTDREIKARYLQLLNYVVANLRAVNTEAFSTEIPTVSSHNKRQFLIELAANGMIATEFKSLSDMSTAPKFVFTDADALVAWLRKL